MTKEKEVWLPVPGWEGHYEASSLGRIRSLDRVVQRKIKGRILSPSTNPRGYKGVSLMADGRKATKAVHAIVAEAFIGPRPRGMEVAHNDGRPANCRSDNLRYATHSDNLADKIGHGTHNSCERHPHAKLTNAQALAVRNAVGSQYEIARRFGLSRSMVGKIRRRERWLDI